MTFAHSETLQGHEEFSDHVYKCLVLKIPNVSKISKFLRVMVVFVMILSKLAASPVL